MASIREEHLVGLEYLAAATTLLQRIRAAHPTAGLYEAADLQWWWGRERTTDAFPQLFWLDDGRPAAAVIATAWDDHISLDPMVLPDADADWVGRVMERGLAHVEAAGFDAISLEVDPADVDVRDVLSEHGFTVDEDEGLVESWMAAVDRPAISPLHDGYELSTRAETLEPAHHMTIAGPQGADLGARLDETSLYRPELDLVVHDHAGHVAAYGLFWFDPTTATGLVEPMRTVDEHQRRGLARHVLTAGLDRLAQVGADRIKICYEPDNPASGHLYRSVGFVPGRQTVVYARRTVDGA